ncbi:MAG: HEPN domain-containing protein, partial [Saprospiraceae bacterium]
AGVVIDLVATLFLESEEKLQFAQEALQENRYGDSIYYSYAAFINTAKTILLVKDVKTNTHHGIIAAFDGHIEDDKNWVDGHFGETVLQINKQTPEAGFADKYLQEAKAFYQGAVHYRNAINLQTV